MNTFARKGHAFDPLSQVVIFINIATFENFEAGENCVPCTRRCLIQNILSFVVSVCMKLGEKFNFFWFLYFCLLIYQM